MKKNKNPYSPFPNFVLRTPLFDFDFVKELIGGSIVNDATYTHLFTDPLIKEAIFLASPTLYFELEKWTLGELNPKKEEKLKLSFLKYLTRMGSRCTPFGLFAGCALGILSDRTRIELNKPIDHQRHTRPDMNYLVALSMDLAKKEHIKNQLNYFPNSSIYKLGNKLRYFEYYYVDSKRHHHIIEIENSEYVERVLKKAKKGAFLNELLHELIDETVTRQEASTFLEELLENQILVSELEPSVSGPPFIEQILQVLKGMDFCKEEIEFLNEVQRRFHALDKMLGNPPTHYQDLAEYLKKQSTSFELKYLFQTDMELSTAQCTLSWKTLEPIKKSMALLNTINKPSSETNLNLFKKAFYDRYEDREMPLSHVLDVEVGIGYIQKVDKGDTNPLVDDLVLPNQDDDIRESNIRWNSIHQLLQDKIIEANKRKERTIRLTDSDFDGLVPNWDDLPDTISSITEFVKVEGQQKIKLTGFGGSSAANILARFGHEGSPLKDYIQEIVDIEEKMYPNQVIAEIVHLPEARVGNILMRPGFRNYEFPYLAKSCLQSDEQISLDDLFISIKNERIILRSKKHQKEVIPRLTNAHNYAINALPIYHFLSDLQTQNMRKSIGFSFGPLLEIYSHIPRVEYENIILHEAQWRIKKEEIQAMFNVRSNVFQLKKEVGLFKEKWELPAFVLLSDGDNELLINLGNMTSVQMLLEIVKNRSEFILAEFLHMNKNWNGQTNVENRHFVNQVVLSFYNTEKVSGAVPKTINKKREYVEA